MKVVRFAPYASAPKVSFWEAVGKRKLKEWRLDETPKPVRGFWSGSRLVLTDESLTPGDGARGAIRVVNNVEFFKTMDKEHELDKALDFVGIIFADMKTNRYVYWFGFPCAVVTPPAVGRVVDLEEADFVCDDPATGADPGWPVRRLVAEIAESCATKRVLCKRPNGGSMMLQVSFVEGTTVGGATGWEVNAKGRMGPRAVDLAPLTDPGQLAAAASSLNIHLMRWRLLPDLDVDKVAKTKCLLLGAGTLGTHVARSLVGWGVRHVTFVDNGLVSYSNPARQCLYTVDDCAKRAKKCEAAASAMRTIAPGPEASYSGHHLTIPMPGHSLADRKDYDTLRSLIQAHDVVFILTDTREARWLPTALALAAPNKPALFNIALGLDTFVVVRHGADADLGCYFCNDVSAPGDSTKDRTLDQQCTVSRPGLAPIASALAVELLVALLHHPQTYAAPPDSQTSLAQRPNHPLGILPHTIRGFLTHFTTLLPHTPRFPYCTACSDAVLAKVNDFEFVSAVAQDPAVLEDTAGLNHALKSDHLDDIDFFAVPDDVSDDEGEADHDDRPTP